MMSQPCAAGKSWHMQHLLMLLVCRTAPAGNPCSYTAGASSYACRHF